MSIVLVGNPKPMSRTRLAAESLVECLTGRAPTAVIDVVDFGPRLLGWRDPDVRAAVAELAATDLLVVASPTYKGTYTGLLKLFLDQIGADELHAVTTIPLMLGAGLQHALAPELLLKPVLVELGCSCPTPGLFLLESEYEDSPLRSAWLHRVRGVIDVVGVD